MYYYFSEKSKISQTDLSTLEAVYQLVIDFGTKGGDLDRVW